MMKNSTSVFRPINQASVESFWKPFQLVIVIREPVLYLTCIATWESLCSLVEVPKLIANRLGFFFLLCQALSG